MPLKEKKNKKKTRRRADQHKCLTHLACINPTLLIVEYFLVFWPIIRNLKKAFH